MERINAEKIKEFLLKKDNLTILILTGVLFLVIAWPVGENTEGNKNNNNMSELWDRSGGNVDNNKTKTDEFDKFVIEIIQQKINVETFTNIQNIDELLQSINQSEHHFQQISTNSSPQQIFNEFKSEKINKNIRIEL